MNCLPLNRCLKLIVIAALGLATLPTAAQNYQTRSVRIIAPFPAGGSSDLVAGTSPQEYAAFIKSEIDKVAKIAKAIGLQPE